MITITGEEESTDSQILITQLQIENIELHNKNKDLHKKYFYRNLVMPKMHPYKYFG